MKFLEQQLGDKLDLDIPGHVPQEIKTTAGEKHMSAKNMFEDVSLKITCLLSS